MDVVSGVKTAKIQRNANIAPAVLQQSGAHTYQTYDVPDVDLMSDPETLNSLVKDLNKLERSDHTEVYTTLRKFKPANFFSTNSLGTHFNILALDNKARWELYRMIQMCKDNQLRKKILNDVAENVPVAPSHTMEEPVADLSSGAPRGTLSEAEKITRMRKLNGL